MIREILGFRTVTLLLLALLGGGCVLQAQMPETTGVPATPAPGAPSAMGQTTQPNGAPLPPGVQNSSSAITGQTSGSVNGSMNSPMNGPMGGQANGAGAAVQSGQMGGVSGESAPATLPISLGDLLEIAVFDTPEMSSRLRVNNRGDILLPLAGYVHVEGLTAPEAAQAVARKLVDSQLMVHPQVSIFIAEYSTQGVTLAGEIRAPGVYPLLGPRTLLDMVTMAGGLGDSASKLISIIHRSDPTKVITVRMNVGVQTPESFAAESYRIQAGDTIFVARSGVVYVVGDLKSPGGFQVEHNERLTLLDAVALGGGPTPTSKLSDARLIRRGRNGREELQVDLKKVLYGSGPDMLLQDGDILFVPVSQRKTYTTQAIQAAIGAATQYGLYKISQQ